MTLPRVAMLGLRAVGEGVSGGVEAHVGELAPRLAAMGCEVTVFCRPRYLAQGMNQWRGVRLMTLPCMHTRSLEALTHTALASLSCLRGFDVIHYHAAGPALFSWLPRLAGRTVVATMHGLDHRRAKWGPMARSALAAGAWCACRFPHRTIAVSRSLADHLAERYGTRVEHIPNGVIPSAVRPLDALRALGVAGPEYILFLGRLVPEKGVAQLIAAFRELDTKRQLVVAGGHGHTGRYEAELRDSAKGDPRIVFTGPLHGPLKDEAFANAGLFVLPSQLEGLPIALLEAAAAGCPVLVSDIPPCREVLEELRDADPRGHVLRTYPQGDHEALKRAMSGILAEPDLRPKTAGVAEAARQRFDWDTVARRTLDIYIQALGRRRN